MSEAKNLRHESGVVILECFIPGTAVPWTAPTFGKNRAGKRIAHSSQALKQWYRVVKRVAWSASIAYADPKEAIELDVTFLLPMPRSWPKTRKANILDEHHTVKPDLTNMVKAIEAALRGVVYPGDQQITRQITAKNYTASMPGVRIKVTVL